MVARSRSGETRAFPVVETVQKDSICHVTEAPAQVSEAVRSAAAEIAERAVGTLQGWLHVKPLCWKTAPRRDKAGMHGIDEATQTAAVNFFTQPWAMSDTDSPYRQPSAVSPGRIRTQNHRGRTEKKIISKVS